MSDTKKQPEDLRRSPPSPSSVWSIEARNELKKAGRSFETTDELMDELNGDDKL
jgi:hypothetical protein